jgi:hypothetical protein
MFFRKRKQTGRVSCWLVGGLGCLGLLVLGGVVIFIIARNFLGSDFVQGQITQVQNQRQMNIRINKIYDAINAYREDNKENFPPNLQALVPKHLPEDQIKPFELNPKTKLEWVYKKPKPNDPDSVVILTHKPAIVVKGSLYGDRKDLYIETHYEYQLQKGGQIMEHLVTIDPKGNKTTTTTPSRNR